jgi:hypothetical protein
MWFEIFICFFLMWPVLNLHSRSCRIPRKSDNLLPGLSAIEELISRQSGCHSVDQGGVRPYQSSILVGRHTHVWFDCNLERTRCEGAK